jgi:hypothetical protein
MNAEELAEQLLSQYKIGTRIRNKSSATTKISARTLRKWAEHGLISRTWCHDGKRGRPWRDFPERAIAEAAALWAIKKTKLLTGYPPTKEEFNRFVDQVGLVYSHYNIGARLARHDAETRKGFVPIFVPFNHATINASPVLNKQLVAKVVVVLEKAKREWPLEKTARVIFDWRLDSVPHTRSIMGKEVIGIGPIFTRIRVRLEEADQNELDYYLLPCDWWPSGKNMLTITDGDPTIEYPHPVLELLEPSKDRQSWGRGRRRSRVWRRKAQHWREGRWRIWRCSSRYWREGRWRCWRCAGRRWRDGRWRVWRRRGWRCGGQRQRGWPREDQTAHQRALRVTRSKHRTLAQESQG